jgi:hypothetical protein
MSDPCYCWEVFSRASHTLATGEGEVKERLIKAGLEISVLHSQQLPEQLGAEYEQLMAALSAKGNIRQTVATMRKYKAKSLAELITNMESTLHEICNEQSRRA